MTTASFHPTKLADPTGFGREAAECFHKNKLYDSQRWEIVRPHDLPGDVSGVTVGDPVRKIDGDLLGFAIGETDILIRPIDWWDRGEGEQQIGVVIDDSWIGSPCVVVQAPVPGGVVSASWYGVSGWERSPRKSVIHALKRMKRTDGSWFEGQYPRTLSGNAAINAWEALIVAAATAPILERDDSPPIE